MFDNFSRMPHFLDKKMDMMLVTIIDEDGSTPRGSGSQMLISVEGQVCGTIGGGAIEKRSEEYALELLARKQSGIRKFELRKGVQNDIGMECGGDATVFFQFIDSTDAAWMELAEQLTAMIKNRKAGWLLLHLDGSFPILIDEERMPAFRKSDGCSCGYAEAAINPELLGASALLTENTFSMPLPVGERALLFGGGHVAKALAPVLYSVGFRIVVMDEREEFVTEERFPMAEKRIVGDYTKLGEHIDIKPDDYIVVMTNGHTHDYDVEGYVLRRETAYVGVIGSAKKTASVNERLREAGVSEDMIDYVHTPIGIDIKATTPEEIAISVTGEMILVRAERRADGGTKACPMSM